jgi:metal-sulfur cluster biosynthetic enzyme
MKGDPFAWTGPDALREPVTAALRKVVDPELAMNIVDIGLVQGVTASPGRVAVSVTMTSAGCPAAEMILDDVRDELALVLPRDTVVRADLTWEPPWTPERMSERARRIMGW